MRFWLALGGALLLTACGTAKVVNEGGEEAPVSEIVGKTWVAEDIGGAGIVPNSDITLFLDKAKRAGGKAGCNTYGSAYQLDGNALTFSQDFSTRMMCAPDGLMAQEQVYLDLMSKVTGYQMAGDKLQLQTSDGKAIVYHPK